MTDDQINIAIAEACGRVRRPDGYWFPHGSNVGSAGIANYCNDLNAMREAEQKFWSMNWELRYEFIYQLAKVVNTIHGYRMQEGIDLLDATARQRAEALLKTINQWEDKE